MNILNNITVKPDIANTHYEFNNNKVPRVTHILSSMLHEDSLMFWANSLGWKRQSYSKTLKKAASIGTFVHEYIESFLRGNEIDLEVVPIELREEVSYGFKSFILWYKKLIKNNEIEIINMEQQLICEWYGGTYDLLIKINGKVYLVDYKTSKHIGYRYYMQLSVYKDLLERDIKIDGIIVLQVSKESIGYNEYILYSDNPLHAEYMNSCVQTFRGLVYSYYGRLHLEQEANNINFKQLNY